MPLLSRDMPCPNCGCGMHFTRCLAELGYGVLCPCRGVPVPGIYIEETA